MGSNSMSMSYHKNDFIAGQPNGEATEKKREDKDAFKLGKTVASLEQKKTENEQASQMNQVQQALLQQQKVDNANKEIELYTMMQKLQSQMGNPMVTPSLPGSLPLPTDPAGAGGGMGGGMPMGGGGGMPPADPTQLPQQQEPMMGM